MQGVLLFGAVVAIVAGIVAWVALGRHDPLATVWERRDERAAAPVARGG